MRPQEVLNYWQRGLLSDQEAMRHCLAGIQRTRSHLLAIHTTLQQEQHWYDSKMPIYHSIERIINSVLQAISELPPYDPREAL
ncbi:MAG: hypothetical protein HC893_06370 [Chloroflexaceae bacterium]|nr:hypothetical protein [Chloroflexaceae bacterium]